MENINPTTLAAIKMLVTAKDMLSADNPQNEYDKEVLDTLSKACDTIKSICRFYDNKRTEMIYTDGACSGNPGPGGWGLVCITDGDEDHQWRQSQGYKKTTNNRMELMAVKAALNILRNRPTQIEIISDSKYVVDAINKGWLESWARNGFTKPMNPDLWEEIYDLLGKMKRKGHKITFTWVKGHAGNKWNEMADKLAVDASTDIKNYLTDNIYEAQESYR